MSSDLTPAPFANPQPQPQSPSRLYRIYRPAFHRHYEIKSSDGQLLFYGNISTFSFKKPEVTLHAGASDAAPIVAACKFVKFSGSFKLALGDPDDVNNVQWEDMTRDSAMALHSRFRFEMTVPNKTRAGYNERRTFLWKRTHNEGVEGSSPLKVSMRNFKLVEESTGQVVAVFNSEISFSKCGVLEVKADYGEAFDIMVVNSYVGLYERARRRNNAAAGGGGGGGGGGG
ncbi:hypothetical protein N7481_011210 [Penicillium waksmanii]|uniref:uncharacterized protein n=1 Tax=Penicillium waksmanii TaxID=69791 RepID=UPI0025482398|nr:uncharacterized protein N7481_011210 [Penicillium waksmanii]KAJ5974000.1 hypothetical protein N7481_011210 [Penicillium waksmanii]